MLNAVISASAKRIWPTVRLSFERFNNDNCLERARSLAYTSLLSLIPVGAIIFAFFRAFRLDTALSRFQEWAVQYITPVSEDRVRQMLNYIRESTENSMSVGIIGLIVLIVTLWMLIAEIETHINAIWKVSDRRSSLERFKSWWTGVTLLPIVVGVSLSVSALPIIRSIGHFRLLGVLLGFLVTWALFFAAYYLFPCASVKKTSALIGSGIAGLMWELVKIGFGYYLEHFSAYNLVYGSLALVPIFLVSLYLTWAIILLGVEITVVVNGPVERSGFPEMSPSDKSEYNPA